MKRQSQGFTLIELMVALTAALFFTTFVFMLSRDVSRFFQGQARTSDTTLATISGFERLRNDIARAGFLSSPNLARDMNACPRPAIGAAAVKPTQKGDLDSFPALQQMALLRVIQGATRTAYGTSNEMLKAEALIDPDQLVLYGNYTTTEQFPARSVNLGSSEILLEANSPALMRIGIDATTTETVAEAILASIFKPGHILRIVDETQREQYALLHASTAPDFDATTQVVTLTLAASPALISTQEAGNCGLTGHASGVNVNPVDIIRYELADVQTDIANHPHLKYLYEGSAPAYDNTRLDLMRYTIMPDASGGNTGAIPAANGVTPGGKDEGELVAEYAVDLQFGLTVLSDPVNGALTDYSETDDISNFAGEPFGLASNLGPHLIRGVHARLLVRQRDADRDEAIVARSGATAEQIFRVAVASNTFARTRSLRSHIAMRNNQNLSWD